MPNQVASRTPLRESINARPRDSVESLDPGEVGLNEANSHVANGLGLCGARSALSDLISYDRAQRKGICQEVDLLKRHRGSADPLVVGRSNGLGIMDKLVKNEDAS